MGKIVGCYIIIKDDFNNVLLLKKKVKRGEVPTWNLLYQKIRGKETTEKCITKGIKDKLKTVIFDLEEYKVMEDANKEEVQVFTGVLRERITMDKEFTDSKWVSKGNYENNDLDESTKIILDEFFS